MPIVLSRISIAVMLGSALAAADLPNLQMRTFCDGKGLSWLDTTTRQRAAQYRMFYNGPYTASATTANINAFIAAVKGINPQTRVGLYLIHYEIQDIGGGQALYSGFKTMSEKVTAENWWLRTTSGARVQWTGNYDAWNICLTGGDRQPVDANNERAPEALARIWAGVVGPTNLDFYYNDNARLQNQGGEVANPPAVDYLLDGIGRKSTDAVVQDAFHAAERRFLDAFERLAPGKRRTGNMGNGDDPLSHAAIRNQWDGANMEGFMGLFWSVDSQNGWTTCMNRARTMRNNLRDTGARELSLYLGLTTVQYPMIRYGLCSALLLDDTLFGMNIDNQGSTLAQKTCQVDEYLARLGDPIDPEPTAARQNGIWMRRYQGGAVIVNPNDNRGRRLIGTTLRRTANVVTLSGWANHGLAAGTPIRILDNFSNAAFDGEFTLTAANSAAGTMSWAQPGADATNANGYGRICVQSSIDLTGLGLRRIGGTDPKVGAAFQDPAINNGQPCGIETLWSSDGFVAVNAAPADTTPPTVSITNPAAGTVSGTITVEASAADDVGIDSVQFKLDGNDLGTREHFAPYTATWDTATATAGSHQLTAVARDAAGNTRTSAAIQVVIANPPPTPGSAPAVSSTTSATPVLSGTTQAGATVRIYDQGVQIGEVVADASGNWSWTVSPALAAGAHALTWTAANTAGTSGASPAATVTVAAAGGAGSGSGSGSASGSASGGCGAGATLAFLFGLAMLALRLR
ncbi:MAG: hypothetical protein J0M02_18650, partial [Planctomycetes bacterium]|nr:hypothetical protein [Planctomycetota bacterium]